MGQERRKQRPKLPKLLSSMKQKPCDSEEAKQGDGACVDKGNIFPEKSDNSFSNPTDEEKASSEKSDGDSKERKFWEYVATLIPLVMVTAIILVIISIIKGVDNWPIATFSCLVLFIGVLLSVWFTFKEEETPFRRFLPLGESFSEFPREQKTAVVVSYILVIVSEIVLGFASGLRVSEFLIITMSTIFIAFVGGAYFCWDAKNTQQARERAIGIATIVSVAGLLLNLLST